MVAQSIAAERSWSSELGGSLSWDNGWQLSVDGYYKTYWDRLYTFLFAGPGPAPGTGTYTLYLYNDGSGSATGVDVMLQKSSGRLWDGWIDYSFNLTRYLNPSTGGLDPYRIWSTFPADAPVGIWYYPIYNRLHTVNVVFNWKPLAWLTVTTSGTFATGTPPYEANPTTDYSDSARTPNVYVLNIKVASHGYYPGSRVGWEFYMPARILVNLLNSGTLRAGRG